MQRGSSRQRARRRPRLLPLVVLASALATPLPAAAQSTPPDPEPPRTSAPPEEQTLPAATPPAQPWEYGGFFDFGYLLDFTDRANQRFRSRGTTWHVNDLYVNMTGVYARKKATTASRWGAEAYVHTGKDDEVFGFSATAPNIAGDEWLRHFGPANVSYLAPAGKGLTLQGGIFTSLIGYDSLYAKDNFNYTRPWAADFTPYLMLGVNASYPLTDELTATFALVNGYWHLAHANNVPSSVAHLAYKPNDLVTVKQTVLFGPHQSDTAFEFWRFLSDTVVERRTNDLVMALHAHFSTERVDAVDPSRAWWFGAQFPVRWSVRGPWSVAVRPEIAHDSDGRWTLAEQTVKALTTTLEYRAPVKWSSAILRLEYRVDDSRGPGGGFFRNGEIEPGPGSLKPTQHLLVFGFIVTLDSPPVR